MASKGEDRMIEVTIGELIKEKRKKLGLTQPQACDGICEPETLSRIENNKSTPSRTVLNALLQRLDISDDRFYAAISIDELRVNELCKELAAGNVRYERAVGEEKEKIRDSLKNTQKELRKIIDDDDKITKQMLTRSEIITNDYGFEETMALLQGAIELTHPRFEITAIKKGIFSIEEIKIINHMAVTYSRFQNSEKAIQIWNDLLINIEERYTNIEPFKNQKNLILFCLARELLIAGCFEKAKYFANEGKTIAINNGIYQHLPGYMIILAESEHKLDNRERSNELFIEAYYLCKAIGDKANEEIVKRAFTDYGYEFVMMKVSEDATGIIEQI